ncbi:GGDEF domain-containing protein [Ottowia sp.]|uniref:GGDEF domain-containing protein n=1 Tax=Ottowia sp. TaxID=1898956 RepID=UPI0025E5F7EF|nr:GGDEF domain-containing protein [Ottowia sp.]MBK6616552.1 GGDEF domain-containing protein [Ottowia sp.]
MRYTQTKASSAEFLRAALKHMGQHDAAFDPITFAVWYEVAAAMNERLSRHIVDRLKSEPRLSDDTIKQLYVDYISEPDEAAVQNIASDLHRLMSGITDQALATGAVAGVFQDTLSGLAQSLASDDHADLGDKVSDATVGTAEMQESVALLKQQLAASRSQVDQLRTALRREREQSLLDPLTRVLNRKGFDLKLASMLADPAVVVGTPHHLMMIDIDHFKSVNDTYGHVMGDRVLQVLGDILRTFANDSTVCASRYGGEEFAMVIAGRTEHDAVRFAETVRNKVKQMKIRDRRSQGTLLQITISIGLTHLRSDDRPATVIARADGALYASKMAGRDRVSFHR